ncbi:unnamed protein product (macronuclear) [Paramecium tetraurelia]|uniref:non-specific serine/threonine protein kinase n=1 Tax=Paramecium tetraurelia TaxID=5888 RepID=A0CHY2_PARTE|nr:uncharacterized protein GSPATT00038501001 [Paramecium tetraurelia]CAK70399.1 unnamed protein product [Paramecium tetraurelia]|eukprot:XP_001437796.1 hypothetical protein (macronuclear) [Paramecium tetraurelia strain d4-2]
MLSSQQQRNIFIQGRGYEVVGEMEQQGAQSINYYAKCSGNPQEQVIIKQYKEIQYNEIELLYKIQKEQNDDKSKSTHIIKILEIQPSSQQKKQINFLIVIEQGKNNLQHLIYNNKSFNLVQKFKLFKQMIKGVKELHALGYCHRDLKPENFVYFENQRKSYTVKLIDFGLAKKDSTRLKTLQVGTWTYMSPEVMIGEGNYDKTADVWSLGIILYQMLTTEYLLKAKNQKDLMFQMHALTQVQINLTIDQTNCMGQQEKEIIKSMLQKESQHRCNLDIILNKIDELLKEIKEQEQKEIQQFKDQKQQCIVQLKDIKSTIRNIIQYLTDKQKIINQINLQNHTKQQLLTYINYEIQKYEEILLKNEQQQKSISEAQTKEMLKEYNNNELTEENEQYQKYQKGIIEKITEEQSQLQQQFKDKEQEQKIRIELEYRFKQEQILKMELEQKLKIEQEEKLKIEFEQKLKFEQEQKLKMELKQKLKIQQEEKLNMELEYQCYLNIVKQLLNQQSPQIELIQDQINFYQIIQMQILEEKKIQDVIKYYHQIKQDIQTVEFQENIIQSYESLQQQIATYQSCNSRLEEIQQDQIRFKAQIEEAIKCIQQIDRQYLDNHQQEIEELYNELIDYQEKYQYLSKNQKYSNQITQIINQIGQAFSDLDKLKQLIFKKTLPAYQEYSQINEQIQKSLACIEKQYSQLHQQIYNDELIELKNQERIKKLEIAKDQLGKFNLKMTQLKDQAKNLIKNEYCNNERTQDFINIRLTKIDQNIMQQQEQFVKFTHLNLLDFCENINGQMKQLEEFQGQLKEVELDEQENINQLELIIINAGKESREKEILTLNNQLQTRYREYTKALQSIKLQSQEVECYKKMNQTKENLQKELEQEISILNQYSQIYQENMQLLSNERFNTQQKEIKSDNIKRQKSIQNIQNMLNNFQQTSQQKGQKLDYIIKNVSQKQQELNFCLIDDNLIKNYEQLKMNEEQLSIELTSINQKIFNQQQNSQQLYELKEHILKVFADIDESMKKIPEEEEIEKFNNALIQNLESFEKVYALINFIKQYHLTRYYERIKVNANQQKAYQQNEEYYKELQSKLNLDQEEHTKKEKAAQDILLRYENVLFKNYKSMTIQAMEKDKKQIEKQIVELENQIKQKSLVKLRSKLKDQNKIKEIINIRQYYKIAEFTQMLIYKIIMSSNNENAQQQQSKKY